MEALLIMVGIVLLLIFAPRLVAGIAGVGCLAIVAIMVVGFLSLVWVVLDALAG
jgi:hypothetical protein